MNRLTEAAAYVVLSLALCFVVFGDAMLGRALEAPLDIPPALWLEYGHLDPHSNGVPRNQHIVDQVSYDLPLQYLLYAGWRSGEVPWWNPYSYTGRPLLADAHCNGADPLRIAVYLAVPDFVLAYNWTRVVQSVVGSLGVFLLLRRSSPAWMAALLGLAWQFAGWKVELFGHPWVEGALLWYPWLWMAWDRAWERPSALSIVLGALCVAASFLAGNLQSHAYLPLFALAVAWGRAGWNPSRWWRAVRTMAPSLLLGGMLATPLLLAEVELLQLNSRVLTLPGLGLAPINGIFAFAGFHPWLLGTPQSGGYGSGGVGAFGFALWAGSAVLPLAWVGVRGAQDESENGRAWRRTALALVIGWVVIVASPLNKTLYARYAGLAVLGLLVLAAGAIHRLRQRERVPRWQVVAIGAMALGTLVVGDLIGRVVYPKFRDKYAAALQAKSATDGYGGRSDRLRASQLEKLPHEISLLNPEVALAALAFVGVWLLLRHPEWRLHAGPWALLLALNLVSPLVHARKLLPSAPLEPWQRLLAGSPKQQSVLAQVLPTHGQLEETCYTTEPPAGAHDEYSGLFPHEMSAFWRVHVRQGYAALFPPPWHFQPGSAPADFVLRRDGTLTANGPQRFALTKGGTVQITGETLCTVNLKLTNPGHGELKCRDTFYPGWRVKDIRTGTSMKLERGEHESVVPPPGRMEDFGENVQLRYQPSGLFYGLILAGSALVAMCVMLMVRAFARN